MSNLPPAMPVMPDLGSLAKPFISRLATKATTTLATAILTTVPTGVVTNDQSTQIAGAVVGIGLMVASVAWDWAKVKLAALKNNAAAATGDPKVDPKSPVAQAAMAEAIANPNSLIVAKVG